MDEQLRDAVTRAKNYTQVLRLLGLGIAGGNQAHIRGHVNRLGLDTSHFDARQAQVQALAKSRKFTRTPHDVFSVNSAMRSNRISWYLRKFEVRPYVCAKCGNPGVHCGQPLKLQVHHKSGDVTDNRLENLEFLCPNCHSQTFNFAGRKVRLKSPRRSSPPRPQKRKVNYDLICAEFEQVKNFTRVGHKYGISATTVRKIVRGSSKGRTSESESDYGGSSPSPRS